ncbi:MAG: hypothetical protein O7G85_13445 [Planctomycetota bacterium]|nr:hypothetical protein [Planctomycetota bacterium]
MQRPEGRFRRQRHPHCPECKYNLIATVEANHLTCPECGYEFELDELWHSKRPGEWSLFIGLRRALMFLFVRSLVMTLFFVGLLWITQPLIVMYNFNFHAKVLLGMSILFILPGFFIGHTLSKKLSEYAGFQSILLGVIASAFALGVVLGSVMILQQFQYFPGWRGPMIIVSTSFFAIGWIIRNTFIDD